MIEAEECRIELEHTDGSSLAIAISTVEALKKSKHPMQ